MTKLETLIFKTLVGREPSPRWKTKFQRERGESVVIAKVLMDELDKCWEDGRITGELKMTSSLVKESKDKFISETYK